MKYILLVTLMLVYLACQQEQAPILAGTSNEFNLIDTTFVSHWEEELFNDSIHLSNDSIIPSISSFEQVIRVGSRSAWGRFEYVCSIYNGNPPRAEVIGRDTKYEKDTDGKIIESDSFLFVERQLSINMFDSLLQAFSDIGIQRIGFDVRSYGICGDCGSEFLAIKNVDYQKGFIWNGQNPEWLNSKDEKQIMDIFQRIFDFAGYPHPKVAIKREEIQEDSTIYSYGVYCHLLFSSLEIQFSGKLENTKMISPDHYGIPRFIIANKDTSDLLKQISFTGIRQLGSRIPLEANWYTSIYE